MPTEHEFKYVLSLDMSREYTEDQLKVICSEHRAIRQGIVCHGPNMNVRIRCATVRGKKQWFMTFKLKDADRTIEIENTLDTRDGEDLWRKCYWSLTKDRYVIEEDGVKWEIDFFKNDGSIYFALAEVELPENAPRPNRPPAFIRKHVLYEVPLTDNRFSNTKLHDVEYARRIYHQLNAKGVADEQEVEA